MASIRERVSKQGEKTWAVLYRIDGKQSSLTFTSLDKAEWFRSLADLLGPARALAELQGEQADAVTLDSVAERFFEWKARDVTERTIADYRRDYTNWIQPHLGHRRISAIDERDVQNLVDHMRKTLDPKSVADRHMVLHSIYKWASAKTRRIVDHNPCTETELPRRKRKAPKGLTVEEFQMLHSAALRTDQDAADLILFLVSTGWRWSEATALTVRGIEEWGDGTMFVTVQRVFRRDDKSKMVAVEDAAKSSAGQRRIKVNPVCAGTIRRRIIGKGSNDLVFTNGAGRKWYQTNFLNRTWPRILAESGMERRPTPHWLRHTHVAAMNRTGEVSLPELQRRLGHESIQTTINVYGRTIDDVSDHALESFDTIMFGPPVISGQVITGELESGLRENR